LADRAQRVLEREESLDRRPD